MLQLFLCISNNIPIIGIAFNVLHSEKILYLQHLRKKKYETNNLKEYMNKIQVIHKQ